MDDVDRRLLKMIQEDFPLTRRPYETLGQRLGLSESETLERIRKMIKRGMVRRIGASFDSGKLGYVTLLVAAKVTPERLREIARLVSEFPEVTHNYSREHEYNLWFTLVCSSISKAQQVLDKIEAQPGVVDIQKLPAERVFKLKFELDEILPE